MRTQESVTDIYTDALIIGSGPLGSTYARFFVLGAPEKKVLMIDAGKQDSKRPGTNVKNQYIYNSGLEGLQPLSDAVTSKTLPVSVPATTQWPGTLNPLSQPPTPPSNYRRNGQNPDQEDWENLPGAVSTFAVGGMAGHWTCATPRPFHTIERIPFIPMEEWNDLLALGENLLATSGTAFDGSKRGQVIRRVLGEVFDASLPEGRHVQMLPVACTRVNATWVEWTGADTVLGPLADGSLPAERFDIWDEHICRRLHCTTAGDKVVWAEIEHLPTNRKYRVFANTFVVAGNSFNTPQLLWNSAIQPRALGHYLTDQTAMACHIVLKQELIDEVAKMWNPPPNDPLPIPQDDPIPEVWIPFSSPDHPFHGQLLRDAFPFVGQASLQNGSIDQRLIIGLFWFSPHQQRFENHVTFSRRYSDRLGMPQVTIHYTLSPMDRVLASRAMDDMMKAATLLGGYLPGMEPQFLPGGSSFHYLGTFRAGEHDDGASVCDPYSKVWGVDNLYLGGNGTIPTSLACNPTLTSTALAVRAAQRILETWGKKGHRYMKDII